ncbi:MAG: electron transfer flavoprotein subunit alpha/FixB family protein [Clostridiaceae bacterium]|jgi:electron transfer flavoprotein alpha subunit|nr:electron transfer flavoprotein subunit alpha/FixB family protein [Clostridiaceae bacterium]
MEKPDLDKIIVYAEHKKGHLDPSCAELVGKAKELSVKYDDNVVIGAVVLGYEISEVVKDLSQTGVDYIWYTDHPKLTRYNSEYYALALEEAVRFIAPELILIAATSQGSELAPTVGARLKTGVAAHCVDIVADDNGQIVNIVPALGGKFLTEIKIPDVRPMISTVKPSVFVKKDVPANSNVQTVRIESKALDSYESRIWFVAESVKEENEKPIEEANVILCAGMGIVDEENWRKLNELAARLKCAVGYTRPVIDLGVVNNDHNMIGTSGKTIRPQLYVGFGVSGASHHICGMKDSQIILCINSDENADIFRLSDYKVIADCGAILDAMLELTGGLNG